MMYRSQLPDNFSVNVGIPIDEDYLKKTGDHQYKSGQRLVIKESDVMRFTDLVEKITTALQGACAKV